MEEKTHLWVRESLKDGLTGGGVGDGIRAAQLPQPLDRAINAVWCYGNRLVHVGTQVFRGSEMSHFHKTDFKRAQTTLSMVKCGQLYS